MSKKSESIDAVSTRRPFRSAQSARRAVVLSFPEQGRTKQAFKAECDINNIMARYMRTGMLEFRNRYEPRYGDVTGYEFHEAMNIVAHARTMFEELPAAVRERFENDPAQFLDFIQDENNREEARELGLLRPEPEPEGGVAPPPLKNVASAF